MIEGVYMTEKDISRSEIFLKIKNRLTNQTTAAKMLKLSVRHTQRLYRAYKEHGVRALISKKRAMPGNRQLDPSAKKQILELISQEIYFDFGPTFVSEILTRQHAIKVSKETVRQLMISADIWKSKVKKRPVIHQQRQRRTREGELVQIDGSPHAWFKKRREPCNLTVFIDDATGLLNEA